VTLLLNRSTKSFFRGRSIVLYTGGRQRFCCDNTSFNDEATYRLSCTDYGQWVRSGGLGRLQTLMLGNLQSGINYNYSTVPIHRSPSIVYSRPVHILSWRDERQRSRRAARSPMGSQILAPVRAACGRMVVGNARGCTFFRKVAMVLLAQLAVN